MSLLYPFILLGMARNLLNMESVAKAFDIKVILDSVSLGVNAGERIGVVGRNGCGKSTLFQLLTGSEKPDSGRIARNGELRLGILDQHDVPNTYLSVREVIVGEQEDHEWAGNRRIREVISGLFSNDSHDFMNKKYSQLSGGERRRVNLAKLLIQDLDLILLDEPTNHLDVEAVAWLSAYIKSLPDLAVLVITHDRWFLDEISDYIWEVVDGKVLAYEGGYSAFVLSKAERSRQAAVLNSKREMLIRKELAWLRRGAPARTSKPKFRIDAANQLIEKEPPARSDVQLLAFSANRLGKTVYEAHHLEISVDDNSGSSPIFNDLTWNIGPGDRIGIVGVNGAGKTTLMRTLVGEIKPYSGKLVTGVTVRPAFLSQHLDELDPTWRTLEAVERVAHHIELGDGRDLSATQLCERLGFTAEDQWKPVGDLSGGERRRLQLTRLLMDSPNVLLLDEPTNDFDIETLTALEDLLDSFAGTLLIISHDRYFLERTCNTFVGVLGDGKIRDLPGGIDEYLELRRINSQYSVTNSIPKKTQSSAVLIRELKKAIARSENQMEKARQRVVECQLELDAVGDNYEKAMELTTALSRLNEELVEFESQWLESMGKLELLEFESIVE